MSLKILVTLLTCLELQKAESVCKTMKLESYLLDNIHVYLIHMYIVKQVTFNIKKLQCWTSAHNAIQLNERSPEQFETIIPKHLNRRNALETLRK